MWKIVVGFVLFAALSMYVIIVAGDKADMGGEKHGADQRDGGKTRPHDAQVGASVEDSLGKADEVRGGRAHHEVAHQVGHALARCSAEEKTLKRM